MPHPALRDYLDRLVERYHLREIGKGYEYLGLYRGVVLHVVEYQGQVALLFYAPGADVATEVTEDFQGFTNWAEAGLSADWLQGRSEDYHSCVVRLDPARIEEIGLDKALELPEIVARDMHDHGAAEELLCLTCEKRPSTVAAIVNGTYTAFCPSCWQDLQERAPRGVLRPEEQVRWGRVLSVLLVGFVVGVVGWGLADQHPLPIILLFVGPFAYGWVFCALVRKTGTGITLGLRLLLLAAVLLAIFVGNVWSYAAILVQKMPFLSWSDAVRIYFTGGFQQDFKYEIPPLTGALAGAWIGLTFLRPSRRIRIR